MNFDCEMGQLVARWRIEAGISQQSLGDAVGIDQASVSRIESGDRRVDVELLLRILDALSLSLEIEAPRILALQPKTRPLWSED